MSYDRDEAMRQQEATEAMIGMRERPGAQGRNPPGPHPDPLADALRRAHSIEVHGLLMLRALERYGFPASEAASTANMSVEARDLHTAARRFQRVINSTGRPADEPAVTNGQ